MNGAGIRALEQARGYYREGVVNATKRVKEATQALEEARIQLAHAEGQVAELDTAIAEANADTRREVVTRVITFFRREAGADAPKDDWRLRAANTIAAEWEVDA